jgi:hypothetical protein
MNAARSLHMTESIVCTKQWLSTPDRRLQRNERDDKEYFDLLFEHSPAFDKRLSIVLSG